MMIKGSLLLSIPLLSDFSGKQTFQFRGDKQGVNIKFEFYSPNKKLISRCNGRTLPREPRHRCKIIPPLYPFSP